MIRVSFISVHGRSFVCGLRFQYPTSVAGHSESISVGLIVPISEVEVSIPAQHHITGVEVALTSSGVIGLRFLVNGPRWTFSSGAGDFNMSERGTGIATLVPEAQRMPVGMVVFLDVCLLHRSFYIILYH